MKLILIYLLGRCNMSGWTECTPTIAIGSGLTPRTIRNYIPTLKKSGILKVVGKKLHEKTYYDVYAINKHKLDAFVVSHSRSTEIVSSVISQNPNEMRVNEVVGPASQSRSTENNSASKEEEVRTRNSTLISTGENTYPNTNVSTYPSGSNSAPQLLPNPSMPSAVSPNPSTNLAEQFEAFFTTSSASALGQDPTPPRQYHDREYMTSVPHSSTLGRYDTFGGTINKPL